MATTSSVPTTPSGQRAQAEKKPFSEYVGVDVSNAGFGFSDDLAAAAAMRREVKSQQTK